MSHGTPSNPAELVDTDLSARLAQIMQALSTPSRLRILGRLYEGPCSVTELSQAVGMEGSAVSHQLRVLRLIGLVASERQGREVHYSLHDDHVGALLEEAMSHVEHLRLAKATG